ncbi:MAG: lipopolysaccharide biosynthesis protein [Vicingus serpentipes]|nr:lipopolysaccharide biosynthesis protein [Vicingus serpentipes]
MSLRKSALSGMFWTFIQQMSTQGISFLVSIILARILLPQEFGLIAMIAVFMNVGTVLINSGLSKSLIRTVNPDQDDFSSIFWFNLILSVLMYGLMFFFASLIAKFYSEPLLTDIIRLYCVVFVINAFVIIQNTRLTKEMDFKKQTLITLPSIVIGSIVGIYMAYNGFGVWSLVWSAITKSIALSVQLWFWSPWYPSFRLKKNKIKYHLNFGYKLTLAGLIDTLFADIYTIIIGKLFNPLQVGFYNRSNTLKQFPIKNFGSVINQVTYPLFSKIQNDNVRLKDAYRTIMKLAVFVITPVILFMAALAEPLFRFLLTEKWLPAVPYFQILCLGGLFNPISVYNLNIITVKGYTNLHLKLSIIKKIFVLTVILISVRWGVYGLLIGQIPLSLMGFIVNGWYSKRLINYSLVQQFKDIMPTIILAIIIAAVVWVMDYYYLNKFNDIVRLTIGITIGLVSYTLCTYLFKFEALQEIKGILLKSK